MIKNLTVNKNEEKKLVVIDLENKARKNVKG